MLALHAVQSATEEAPSPRACTDPYGEDEELDPRTPRVGTTPEPDITVQSLEETDDQSPSPTDMPVATSSHQPQQPTLGGPQCSQSLRHLALDALPPETSPITLQPLGSPAFARAIEKSAAARACLTLRLQNDGVVCYVNASLVAFLWGMIQRQTADWADFAGGEQAFHSLLTSGQYNAFALETPDRSMGKLPTAGRRT